jgi:RNA polymerase sigma-70 factor (ECF subfamily)
MSELSQALVVEFYQQQHKALVNFLQSKLGSTQEALDVAQQTYERLLNNDKTQGINNPRAFVYRVANNLAIDHLRQRKVRGDDEVGDFDGNELISPTLSPEEQVDNELMVAMVRLFITELPPKCRSAFLHYKFEEREYADIAAKLGVSESMVRKYVLRAVAYCRQRLDQCMEIEAVESAVVAYSRAEHDRH